MTKAALNSSVTRALSATGHVDELGNVFDEPLAPEQCTGRYAYKGTVLWATPNSPKRLREEA